MASPTPRPGDDAGRPTAKPVQARRIPSDEPTPPTRPASRPPTQGAKRPARPAVAAGEEYEYADDVPTARRPAKAAGGGKLPLILAAVGAFVVVAGGLGGYLALSGREANKPVETAAAQPAVNPAPAMESATPAEKPAAEKPAAEKPPAKVEKVDPAAATGKPADPPKGGSGLAAPLSAGAVAKPDAASSTVPTKTDIDQITLDKCKAATVYIECETHNGSGGSGTGWLGLEPNLVWTNAHVISMIAPGSKKPKKLTIVLSPGTNQEREVPNNRIEILAVDRNMDLALLRINNEANLPPPLPIRLSAGLRDRELLIPLGYPGGKKQSYMARNTKPPAVTVSETKVMTLRKDDNGDLYTVQVSGGISWGNSGGPIVDVEGRVSAVSVRVDLREIGAGATLTGIAYGVPTEYVSGLLAGRIGEVEYGQAYKKDKMVHVPVTVTCLDPFDRITKVGFGCWLGERTGKPRPPGAKRTGEETGDTDFREVELTYKPAKDKKVATGELVFPEAAADRAYWAQPFYANGITPKHWMGGNQLKMLGVPVDRQAVELSAVFKPGTVRSLTLQNKNSLSEFEEGEGADREDRTLFITQVSGREASLAPPKNTDYAAQLRMRFEKVSLTAERGAIKFKEQQVLPKEIRKAFAEGIKLCEGFAFQAKTGEVVRTQADVRRVPGGELNQRVYKEAIIDPVMDSLLEASVPLPNKQVQPGDTWKQVKSARLAVQFIADARVAPTKKDDDDDDDKSAQRPGQPKGAKQIKGLREYKYQEETTYKYVGVRTRQGVKEAVLEVSGEIKPAPGASEAGGATGKLKGYACLDLDTGTVIESEVDREFEIDSSIDGTKRRLSAINNYRITRSTPSAGTN